MCHARAEAERRQPPRQPPRSAFPPPPGPPAPRAALGALGALLGKSDGASRSAASTLLGKAPFFCHGKSTRRISPVGPYILINAPIMLILPEKKNKKMKALVTNGPLNFYLFSDTVLNSVQTKAVKIEVRMHRDT